MQRKWVVSPEYRAAIDTITTVRKELGISQRELARRLGKPPSFINKIELLERRLDVLEFIAIAEAMDMKAQALLVRMRQELPTPITL